MHILYAYLIILSLLVSKSSQTQLYLIGTGRGILTAVGDNIKEIKWDPNSFGKSNQLWSYEIDSKLQNGSFIKSSGYNKVWDAQGYSSKPGNPVILYTKKATLSETRNQRWVWTENHQIYPVMNTSSYVTVTPQGDLTLNNFVPDNQYQYFIPVDPTIIQATIRNYFPDILASVSISGPFGNYNFGNSRFQQIPVLKGFIISIKDKNGETLHAPYPVTSNDKCGITLVVGTPSYPSGIRSWTMRKLLNGTNKVQNFRCNMTFSNNKISGTAREVTVVFNETRGVNVTQLGLPQSITGNYKNDGTVTIYFDFVDYNQGNQYNGVFYPSSTFATISGTWEDLDARNYNKNGPFEFTQKN